MIRCGRISYTNDLPVYAAFDAGAVEFPGTLVAGVPTELNAMLLAGALDVSPISSYFYAQHADALVLLPEICIGSRREVRSIYCISAQPQSSLAGVPIAVTRESATGRALFATICAAHYGFTPSFVEADDPFAEYAATGSPCVVIGDRAIDAFLAAPREHAYDLGDLWHELTGLEMVYAVWAVRRDVLERDRNGMNDLHRALTDSLEWGHRNIGDVARQAQSQIERPPGFYDAYYGALNFRFDGSAQTGLSSFLAAASATGLLNAAPRLEFFNEVPSRV